MSTNSVFLSIPRLIARLDIKGPNLVKGINFEGLRVLGKPHEFSKLYYCEGADELIYMDAVASLYGRNSLLEVVEQTSREIFIPLTVGGGLRNLDDIRAVLRAGADKVAINSAAIEDPSLISMAAETFGSSTIVISVEAFRTPNGRYEAYTQYGRERTDVDAVEWALHAVERGAGELMVTCINNEGTGVGVDTTLTKKISSQVKVPVIAGGGVGTLNHVEQVFSTLAADAVAVASALHYEASRRIELNKDAYTTEGNVEYRSGGLKPPSKITPLKLMEIKKHLSVCGIPCRDWSHTGCV